MISSEMCILESERKFAHFKLTNSNELRSYQIGDLII